MEGESSRYSLRCGTWFICDLFPSAKTPQSKQAHHCQTAKMCPMKTKCQFQSELRVFTDASQSISHGKTPKFQHPITKTTSNATYSTFYCDHMRAAGETTSAACSGKACRDKTGTDVTIVRR